MRRTLAQCVLILTGLAYLRADVYRDRPTIKANDGHLIIQPAADKNIYLLTNGFRSTVFVAGVNALNINVTRGSNDQSQPDLTDLEKYINEPGGILERLSRLESSPLPGNSFNVTLWRKYNQLRARLSTLETRIQNMAIDKCNLHPCLHGGTCLNLANAYHCLCPKNWEGKDCDVDVNECRIYQGTELGCQNLANCKNLPGSYECECRPGWYGIHCTRRRKDCSAGGFEMCGHGTCVTTASGEGITCICDQGWTTNGTDETCLTDVNECESTQGPRCSLNPRVECINLPGSFRCGQCPSGYEGDGYICSDIDECTTSNGGCSTSPFVTCHNTVGSRICGPCPTGYQGDGITCSLKSACSIDHGGCHPSAQCVDNAAAGEQMVQCICPQGTDGDGIGLHGCYVSTNNLTRGCDSKPCGIHGQCHPLRFGYTCFCVRGYGGAHCNMTQNYCDSNPCLNGGTCRNDQSLPRGFRCECTYLFHGELCHLPAKTCGGHLSAEEGSIVYPTNNQTYENNVRCAWVINTESNKVINVTFSKFNLESGNHDKLNEDCNLDFLQIHDGISSSSQLIGRFCGSEFPRGGNIISSHNNLYLWFRSDSSIVSDGFALHWTSINPVCGGEIDATVNGHISSPGSPGKYPPNRDCYWHITTTYGKRIQLHFYSFDIESHSNCSFDSVTIYDGALTTDPLLGRYCSSSIPAPVTSSGSEMLVHFHSDGFSAGYGFQATFAPADGIPGCGGLYTTDKGEISSPSYDGKYLSGITCEYQIRTDPETKIRINFKSFHLEYSTWCKYDYLKVYDGSNENSPLVGKFCGRSHPESYTSSTNQIFIIFRSDAIDAAEGFRFTYETICHQVLQGDSGFIKSPGYPLSYPANRMCEYLIGTTPRKAIQLTFQDFDIEDNSFNNCLYDNIEIRDGLNVNATLLGKFCGNQYFPPVLTSTHNYMYLRFSSDTSISGTGFYANFTTLDVECGGIYRDSNMTINFIENRIINQHCMWMIIAPESMVIKLTWNEFDLKQKFHLNPTCVTEYVSLTEIDENNENIELGKFCGNNKPLAVTTTTNKLRIYFYSNSSIRFERFSVSYEFLDERFHCGGNYTQTQGILYSPGWPKRLLNRKCKWSIIAPPGRKITLNITYFGIRQSGAYRCSIGDFLEIRNGVSEKSPLIGTYCGTFYPRRIISLSNSLFIYFESDSYVRRPFSTGFQIKWNSAVTGCGGVLTGSTGTIMSPNYPFNYHENAECFYKIVTTEGSKIRINVVELDLENTHSCRSDYVEFFDGRDENAASFGKFCELKRELNDIESTMNYMFVKFRSDYSIGGKGFLIEYITICQNNLTGLHGVIESPGFPGLYPVKLNCLWTITVPKGNSINATFTQIDIPLTRLRDYENYIHKRYKCDTDYLQIRDLADANFNEKICNRPLHDRRIITKGNLLQIKFVTGNNYFNKERLVTGFRLEWASCGCGGHIKKRNGSINIDNSLTSRGEIECEWLIEGQPGTSITVHMIDLYMADTKNCTIDAIEFYNGQNTKMPLFTKICHQNSDSQISYFTSGTSLMLIRFVKKSTLKDVYFSLRFNSYQSGCGGRIDTLSGFIHSENYPNNYNKNSNCKWTIYVPQNHRIELNFTDINLYHFDDHDCNDRIQIYDDEIKLSSNYTKLICPSTKMTHFISRKNVLVLQFISDSSGSSKGFKASFTVICGATITADHDGIIAIDKWHTSHIVDNCSWTLIAPSQEQKISLTITFMSIPKDKNTLTNRRCPSTFLRVVDGDNADAPLVDEYCGRKIPPMVVSRGSAMTLVFAAYNGTAQGQFSAHYSSIMSACGGVLTSEEGSIASPNYPQSYPIDSNCEWILSTSPGNKVYITFEQFDIKWSENCNEDYLEVRENDAAGNLLGVYCGTSIPTNTSSATKLYIKFKSNKDNSGKGFLMRYGFLHGNEIYGLEKGEVASPHLYEGAGDFFWRISTERETISIVITTAEIPSDNPICTNSLIIYDGYDEHAPILENLCGVLKTIKEIKTTTNTVFIQLKLDETNSGSIFYIQWANSDTSPEPIEQVSRPNCGFNKTKSLTAGQTVTITSPGYPNNYRENLNCEWVFKAPPGQHVNLHFLTFKLEETEMCFADSLSIYSANTPTMWKAVKEEFCLSSESRNELNSSTYMKIVFKTDSSNNKEGFQAQVYPLCGGIINDLSGVVEPRYEDFIIRRLNHKCEWTIKVRPDRKIKLHFEHFNITNTENECGTYVIIRNGDSIEAPMLGNGKYCGREFENREDLETSSNAVFISYHSNLILISPRTFRNFRIHFEEKGMECGGTFALDEITNWKVFNSPDYPNVPTPYSECEWVFKGPPGVVLRIEFIERFDLEPNDDCSLEFVEIRDGLTDLAPLVGRYCKPDLSTIKTRDNNVYVKYYTQLSEPRNGFKANVSIDVCGGTINAVSGEITSPGYPRLLPLPRNTKCEWRIIGLQRYNLLIKTLDMHLPIVKGRNFCNTNVTIEEYEGLNNMAILKTFCATGLEVENHDHIYDMSPISTSGNEVVIKFELGDYSAYNHITRGFRFKFLSTSPICGGQLTIPEGFITSPGYPQETTMSFCMWHITVPDKTRRIRLEILDSNSERHLIAIFNGYSFHTAIKGLNENLTTNMYESTGNIMTINLVLKPGVMRHRFKARFSSDEASLCGGELHEPRGVLASSPDLNGAYTCEWHFKPKFSTDTANPTTFNTLYINAKLNSSRPEPASYKRSYCLYSDPKLNLGFKSNEHFYNIRICGITEKSIIIPVTEITLYAMKNKEASSYYQVKWKLYPCGGIIEVSENPTNIFNLPDVYNETLECAWLLTAPLDTRVELKIEGSFQSDCVKEIVYIGRGYDNDDYSNAQNIGEYCTDKMQILPLRVSFNTMSVRYHFDVKNKTQLRLIVKSLTDHCGETLTDKQPIFKSPNYPKNYDPNIECSWEIVTDVGNRISLHFIESFRIEERSNCSKDAVLIYDRDDEDDSWVQLARLCGRSLPPTYNSTHNRMKVVLRTDADVQMDGFKARWEPICGGTYIATDKLQYLHSPGRDKGFKYLRNMNCRYSIQGGGEKKIIVKFLEFSLEDTCKYDNLTIRYYDYIDDSISHIGVNIYCGSEIPTVPLSSKVDLIFRSDSAFQRKGFKLIYQIHSCGGHIKSPTVIHSNPYTKQYGAGENCTWVIEAPIDKIVVIKFQYIYLFLDVISNDCASDHVSVFDSIIIDENKRIARMCGNINTTTILRTTNNTMVVQFESDFYGASKGFQAEVYFVYSSSVGCGGEIDLTSLSPGTTALLNSPLINGSAVYENYLDCQWSIKAPIDYNIKIKFTQFHIASCEGINQTSIGYSNCDCDFVEVIDGVNPHDLIIGTYCGYIIPGQELMSSKNMMSLRMYTDGEIVSAGFKAELSLQRQICGQTVYEVNYSTQTITSPGYSTGSIPSSLRCIYYLDASTENKNLHIHIKNLDLQAGKPEPSTCNMDKLLIAAAPQNINAGLGKDYIFRKADFNNMNFYKENEANPDRYEFCGFKTDTDIYLTGSVSIHLQTYPESGLIKHKGFEIEFSYVRFCGRNYTELQGRIKTSYGTFNGEKTPDCYTFITVPKNFTISLYFIFVFNPFTLDGVLDIYDGSTRSNARLHRFTNDVYDTTAIFSSGNQILLYNQVRKERFINYELVYMATDKGRGCGGKLQNVLGSVTSPLYPDTYQKQATCEWELETPSNTRLRLKFTVFDLGIACDGNYVQLVGRSGETIATYCDEPPAVHTSTDNYVKIVYATDRRNSGTGWVANFKAVL